MTESQVAVEMTRSMAMMETMSYVGEKETTRSMVVLATI